MKRFSAFFGIALLSGCGIVSIKPEVPQFNDRTYLLGPEVQTFCGGTVELWAKMDTTSWKRDIDLYIKASSGAGANGEGGGGFEISNENLLVEAIQDGASQARKRKLKDIKALEFVKSTSLDTSGSTNVGKWKLTAEGLDPNTGIKVFLKPFRGCQGQQAITPVVLRERTTAELNLD
ncbi:MAG: hypothetical protein JNL01_08450 [Bdellovibrionales bacterium]|nr:hypothetical protein [Bdellovibrionales bacterium]